jgi:hypothetical protein
MSCYHAMFHTDGDEIRLIELTICCDRQVAGPHLRP